MTDLHSRLLAAVQQRMDVARAATPGPWHYQAQSLHMDGSGTYRIYPPGKPQVLTSFMRGADPIHIAANDPATIVRHCERDLAVLERHAAEPGHYSNDGPSCQACAMTGHDEYEPWPCPEITDLAAAYGVDVDGG